VYADTRANIAVCMICFIHSHFARVAFTYAFLPLRFARPPPKGWVMRLSFLTNTHLRLTVPVATFPGTSARGLEFLRLSHFCSSPMVCTWGSCWVSYSWPIRSTPAFRPRFPKIAGQVTSRNDACLLGAQHTCSVMLCRNAPARHAPWHASA
jgi:hypothetical protein